MVNPQIQDESDYIGTIFREHTNNQNFKVKRVDFIFACDELGIDEPDKVTEVKEYVFSDVDNFDLIKSFLKQNELLAWS